MIGHSSLLAAVMPHTRRKTASFPVITGPDGANTGPGDPLVTHHTNRKHLHRSADHIVENPLLVPVRELAPECVENGELVFRLLTHLNKVQSS